MLPDALLLVHNLISSYMVAREHVYVDMSVILYSATSIVRQPVEVALESP